MADGHLRTQQAETVDVFDRGPTATPARILLLVSRLQEMPALVLRRGAGAALRHFSEIWRPAAHAQRAKTSGVRTVVCDGEVIYSDGRFTKVDRDAALRALHEDLQKALSDDEVERRRLSKALLPHIKAFYAGYFDPEQHQPFYRPSSRR